MSDAFRGPRSKLQTLEAELAQLEKRRERLWDNLEARVGIHGVPNAGKTAFLVSMYLHRNDANSGIRIRFDEPSLSYLRQAANYFVEHGQLESNAATSPTHISFTMTTEQGLAIKVDTLDFAGRFVEPRSANWDGEVAMAARNFMKTCDAILCLADWSQDAHPILDAIDLLPEKSHIVFVPTKIDELLDDPETLLQASPQDACAIYQSINLDATRTLERYVRSGWPAGNYETVPIAALGPIFHRGGVRIATPIHLSYLRPWNLYAPWQFINDIIVEAITAKERALDMQIESTSLQILNERATQRHRQEARQRRRKELELALRELEHELDGVWNDLWSLGDWHLRLRRIHREAKEAGWDDVARKAVSLKLVVFGWLSLALFVGVGCMIALVAF